jgi:hypothetical protein
VIRTKKLPGRAKVTFARPALTAKLVLLLSGRSSTVLAEPRFASVIESLAATKSTVVGVAIAASHALCCCRHSPELAAS